MKKPFNIKTVFRVYMCFCYSFLELILGLLVMFIPGMLFAYFLCSIDPWVDYGWFAGIWHGLFSLPNMALCIFNDNIYYFALNHSTFYTIFYWISALATAIPAFSKLFEIIITDFVSDIKEALSHND